MSVKVEPGQVWVDCDWRSSGRSVRVIEVDDTHATVEVVSNGRGTYAKPGRRTRILLRRFKPTSTGYRLSEDRNDEAAS